MDSAGNVYVADSENNTIRKVTQGGVVTTLAGLAGASGTNDGTGSAARFDWPCGVAVDSGGNVYVADAGKFTIRKVTQGGVVTTLAGLAGASGTNDGTGSAARFGGVGYGLQGVAVDSGGNVYVADTSNDTIRKVTPGGVVTTLAGLAEWSATTDGTGSAAQFALPFGVAVDSAGNVYVADTFNYTIRKGAPACPDAPTIDLAVGPVGASRQLDTSPQTAVAWQWRLIRDPAASSAALSAANIRNPTFTPDVADLYIFRLYATNAGGAICIRTLAFTAMPVPPTVTWPPQTQTAEIGSLAVLSVAVTNTVPGTTYQWYFDGTNALAGATNASLGLANLQPAQAGAYTLVVTDGYGSVTSPPAALSVIAPVPRRTIPALHLTGGVGSLLHLDCADALAGGPSWQVLGSMTLTNPPQFYLDLTDPVRPYRFYRAWQTNAPTVWPAVDVGMAIELTLTGTVGSKVRVDCINQYGPTDAWVTLDTVILANTTQPYFDLSMWRQPARLYRLVQVP